MQEITDLERRITAALDRIGRGIDALDIAVVEPPAAIDLAPVPAATEGDAATLRAELETERAATAQLRERLRAVRDRETLTRSQLEEKAEKMTRQLDVQGLELQRMRKTAVLLREELRRLREAQEAGTVDAAQINRAMLAELDALRATRLSELAELDEISAALDEHITEAENA
ncbi:hypothetical protein LHP98_04160 [Rhodobacter sp. Har01]|uniref:hypothetical protein n=1 Tax=Rhodobacter sp. Har01 TaxID=2883999 RepID=UPI001D065E42|nr:hypothetical protein [Rhodobacter sp. Har01]MCB6177321.1 hypothetical protein [Rhodobacter sp. Har01]